MRAPIVGEHPHGFGHILQALDFYLAGVREVAIVSAATGEDAGGGGAGARRARRVRAARGAGRRVW